MSTRTCSYGIEFFFSQGLTPATMLACTIQMPDIPKFNTVFPCSRNLPSSLAAVASAWRQRNDRQFQQRRQRDRYDAHAKDREIWPGRFDQNE